MPTCARCGGANAEPARFCSHCGDPLPGPSVPTARKVVTALFSDVSGFTALGDRLDPESLQQLIGEWFDEAERIIAHHGGTVEKFMGDEVMAVFGVPTVHEDDALRAARAALELRDTLVELNERLARRWGVRLAVHTGVDTGEAIIGLAPGGEASTSGDAVNAAQRLEAAARPGEVLIGEETARLIRGAADLDRVDNSTAAGTGVAGWRLVAIAPTAGGPPERLEAPFVGRDSELDALRRSFELVVAERTPRQVTILGPAGIGKSRLVGELLAELGSDATAVIGRCLPYGEGITYWPVVEIVRQLSGATSEAALASLVGGGTPSDESRLVASRVARAAGLASGALPVEEAQWGVRRLLEGVARREPLIVVVEDIHWAEPTLLDLLEHLATRADDVPLLLVCLARPELLDDRPSWLASAGARGSLVRLDALTPGAAGELLERLSPVAGDGADERALLLDRAEGNPFFLQQMVAMRSELGDPTELPPTIQAVLTARIDSLPRAERAVIERASIEGRTFHRGALAELLPEDDRDGLDATLATLVRRGLVAPHRPDFRGERGYSFEHILIRDATYALIPKQVRAELHERHAHWLEAHGDESGEHLELAGYHLEQAFRWHVELEPAAAGSYRPLAAAGGRHLGAAGRAALARDDTPAAIAILERATALLPADDGELGALLPELGIALTEAGRLADAEQLLSKAVDAAADRCDARAEAHALAARLFVRLQADTEAGAHEVRERFEQLLINFERSFDDLGLSRLWRLRALVHWIEACSAKAEAAWENAAEHARLAGDERGWAESLSWLASSAHVGPTPAEIGVGRCEDIHAQLTGHRRSQALVLEHLAALRAMQGEFDEARGLLTESRALMAELGTTLHTAVSHDEAFVALASGDPDEAEALLRAGYDRLSEMGEKALLATTAAMLADVVYERGRPEEAWELTVAAEAAAATDDVSVQIGWRAVRARLLARRDEPAEARRLSEAAVALAGGTDWLTDHGDALVAHADVLQAMDEDEEAGKACEEAVALYTRKGNSVGVERARALLGYSPAV